MRIRKNAKLSPLLCVQGGSVPVETHVCQLNQSPWDVISFDSDSIQFQLHDTFAPGNYNNGSAGDSTVLSIASTMDTDRMTTPMLVATRDMASSNKKEPKQEKSFSDQHLSFSHPTSYTNKSQPTGPAASRRPKTRGAVKKAAPPGAGASSNPYEFYYYSGFGPLWGKRRGDRNGGEGTTKNALAVAVAVGIDNSTMIQFDNVSAGGHNINDNVAGVELVPSGSKMDNERIIDYVDDDEEEEEEEPEEDGGKKRMRKPIKARSLKSLM